MTARPPTFVRERPRGLLRLFLAMPPKLYHGPFARLLAWRCVMLLTTTGRKTGLPRTTAVSFMPFADRWIIFSGFGIHSNWYRNILAHSEVTVRIGNRRWRATAHVVEDPARRRELMLRMRDYSRRCGPPIALRPLLRALRLFDYDAEIALAVAHAEELPVVEIVPHTRL
ncbi:nitroreductase family deazaflavin-dependent oxidoreductase [Thermomicrobiaceae bacterium CFH 74404]|uniref:Nitroreductase family deazaflavin-dependent oxidoreductase n=1 Tax=Thermalbibacter longus TaxID=2951981 RepID=A0AA41WDF2_9BACT|nr:nitroreductase family deazaflavin-dependent oxidoreductase [Thermalbibacter longus]MCM8748033.1 nitroreductase family deazaflavin-dependent oxidoreductase [Thermalbibacter longus]